MMTLSKPSTNSITKFKLESLYPLPHLKVIKEVNMKIKNFKPFCESQSFNHKFVESKALDFDELS